MCSRDLRGEEDHEDQGRPLDSGEVDGTAAVGSAPLGRPAGGPEGPPALSVAAGYRRLVAKAVAASCEMAGSKWIVTSTPDVLLKMTQTTFVSSTA